MFHSYVDWIMLIFFMENKIDTPQYILLRS